MASRWSLRSVLTASRACHRSALSMVIDAVARALVALCEAPMLGPSETLVSLEQRLAERLLAFELLTKPGPCACASAPVTGVEPASEFLDDMIETERQR